MSEQVIEQAIEVIDDGRVLDTMGLIDCLAETSNQAESLKERTVRSALAERAFDEISIADFIRNKRSNYQKKLPRHEDDDVNRDLIRETIARYYRLKLLHRHPIIHR